MQMLISTFLISYLAYQHVLPVAKESVPYFEQRDTFNIILSGLQVSIPCSYMWLLFFFGTFHAFTNFLAELTCFEDRRFYADWWNAGSLSEYWRKWNQPIHNWLVRHCYYPLVRRGINVDLARFLTFLVSALAHEYIAVGVFRLVNFVAFSFMIVNVPIMKFQAAMKHVLSERYNNIVFWTGYCVIG